MKEESNGQYTKFDKKIGNFFLEIYKQIGIAGSLVVLILFIVLFIWIITSNSTCFTFEISSKHNLGDALGGLTSPFIGIIGVVLTFLAFYVQFDFNKKQTEFYKNDKIERKVDEYNITLQNLIAKDSLNNYKYVEFVCIKTIDRLTEKIENPNNLTIPILELFEVYFVDEFKKLELDTKYELDESEISDILHSIVKMYGDFYVFLNLFLKQIKYAKLDKSEYYDLIESFINKFSILYYNHSDKMIDFMMVGLLYDESNKNEVYDILLEYFTLVVDFDRVQIYSSYIMQHGFNSIE